MDSKEVTELKAFLVSTRDALACACNLLLPPENEKIEGEKFECNDRALVGHISEADVKLLETRLDTVTAFIDAPANKVLANQRFEDIDYRYLEGVANAYANKMADLKGHNAMMWRDSSMKFVEIHRDWHEANRWDFRPKEGFEQEITTIRASDLARGMSCLLYGEGKTCPDKWACSVCQLRRILETDGES